MDKTVSEILESTSDEVKRTITRIWELENEYSAQGEVHRSRKQELCERIKKIIRDEMPQ